jgi:DNA-binding NtrC family response regulator
MKDKGKYTGEKDCKNNAIYAGNIIKIVKQNRFFEVCYAEKDDKFYAKSNVLSMFLEELMKQCSIEIVKENSIDEFDKSFDNFNNLSLQECEFKIVKQRLKECNNNITQAAESLKISRSRVYRIMNNEE